MSGARTMVAILAIAITVGGFSAGRLVAQLASPEPRADPTPSPAVEVVDLPDADETGHDLLRLPRYPGSKRTAFERLEGEGAVITRATYAARAARNEVRAFYTDVFREHAWTIVDLEFTGSTWTFIVERKHWHATVEVSGEADTVLVRLDATRAIPQPPSRATPGATLPPPPPPDDDDDDDDDDDGEPDDDDPDVGDD